MYWNWSQKTTSYHDVLLDSPFEFTFLEDQDEIRVDILIVGSASYDTRRGLPYHGIQKFLLLTQQLLFVSQSSTVVSTKQKFSRINRSLQHQKTKDRFKETSTDILILSNDSDSDGDTLLVDSINGVNYSDLRILEHVYAADDGYREVEGINGTLFITKQGLKLTTQWVRHDRRPV